jgi:hypothetical protein
VISHERFSSAQRAFVRFPMPRSAPRPAERHRLVRRVLPLALLLAVLLSGCSEIPVGLSRPPQAAPSLRTVPSIGRSRAGHPHVRLAPPRRDPPPRLHVSGTLLETPDGRRVVLRGVNVYALPFYLGSNGGAAPGLGSVTRRAYLDRFSLFRAIRATGANAVRIPLSSTVYFSGTGVYGIRARAGYLGELRAFVDAASDAGLYVVLSWWDALGQGAMLLNTYESELPMMAVVAKLFSGMPNVIYEPYNEPNDISWTSWLPMIETTIKYWRTTIGYSGVLIIDTIDYSWIFSPTYATAVMNYDASILGRANLVFANHWYPNGDSCFCTDEQAQWMAIVGGYVRSFPILGTEYGISDGTGPTELSFGVEMLSYIANHSIPEGLNGAFVFAWNWIDPNAMTAGPRETLTPWGAAAARVLLSAGHASSQIGRLPAR